MANYHLSSKIISRAKGKSIVASAAYRACTQLNDNSIGVEFNYVNKRDLVHSEILFPENSPSWVSDRGQLWNEVETAEKRIDSQLAREIEVSLPLELNTTQHVDLIRDYVNENFVSRGMIADINIHNKHGNPHAHVLLSLREITTDGFGQKDRSWNNKSLIHTWRKSWADIQNQHLTKAGFDISVDQRSYADQGINIEPQIHLGPLHQMEPATVAEHDRMVEYKRIAFENGNRIINDPTIAINHLANHNAVFSNYDIMKCANLYSYGQEQFELVKESIENHSELEYLGTDENGVKRYTSKGMMESEKIMFANVAKINERFNHNVYERFINQAAIQKTMTVEQLEAFEHILNGSDISALIGVAGAGKSFVLGAINDAYTAQGLDVQGCAISGIASEGLQESSGIKSKTITKLLWELSHGKTLNKKTVLVVDEAGMIGTKQMHLLVNHVENSGAKIVLVGDTQQTQAIAAGGAFRGIVERVQFAKIENVFRQESAWQKIATTEFSSNNNEDIKNAINKYNDHGYIKFADTYSDAKDQLILEWSDSIVNNRGESSIILAFKRDDVNELNFKARDKMKELGLLGTLEYEYSNQESISNTKLIGTENETEFAYNTKHGTLSLSVNDRVMFTKNNDSIGVKNGSIGIVHGIRKNQLSVKLDSGKIVVFDTREYNDLTYGYAATINKTQGLTIDRSFTLASTQLDKHLTYVAMSRHRKEANLYAGGGIGNNEKYCFENYEHFINTVSQDRSKDLVIDYAYLRGLEPPENRIYSINAALNNIKKGNISDINGEIIIKFLTRNDAVFNISHLRSLSNEFECDFELIKKTVINNPEIVRLGTDSNGFDVFSSLNNINAELNMFRNTDELFNHKSFNVDNEICERTINKWTLEPEQSKSFNNIIKGKNISSFVGYAGTGKSHILGAINEAYTAQGYNVYGCAISGIAAQGLTEDAKIKSTTIYRILRDWNQGKNTLDNKSILVIDEAGLIGTTQMEQLLKHAANKDAKVILAGDYQQLQAIATGGPFKGIIDKYGSEKLVNIRRQKIKWHKAATKELAGNEIEVRRALSRYFENGNIHVLDNHDDAKKALISDWKNSLTADLTKTNSIFAYRRKDVEELNLQAREIAKEMGFLDTQEFTFKTIENTNNADLIHLDDDLIFYPQDKGKSFSRGDRFIFLRNDEKMGVKNGTLGTIVNIDETKINVKLDINNSVVTVEPNIYNEFSHGYASTIHKTQGVTVDNSFVLASPQFDKHLTYVSMTRHKDDVNVYANFQAKSKFGFKDKAHFMEIMSQEKLKDLAVDYTKIPNSEIKNTQEDVQKVIKPFEEMLKDAKMTVQELIREAKEIRNHNQLKKKQPWEMTRAEHHKANDFSKISSWSRGAWIEARNAAVKHPDLAQFAIDSAKTKRTSAEFEKSVSKVDAHKLFMLGTDPKTFFTVVRGDNGLDFYANKIGVDIMTADFTNDDTHYNSVKKALSEGKIVAENILKGYPDLVKKETVLENVEPEAKLTAEIAKVKPLVMDTKLTVQELRREAREIHDNIKQDGEGNFMEAFKDIQNGLSIGDRKDEIERFKKEINLSEYAAFKGYMYDKKDSYSNIIAMRSDHEKINISKGQDGHWVYHNGTSGEGGSIIDFVQKNEGKNLGEVRKELRPWIGENSIKPHISEVRYQKNVKPIMKDREGVLREFKEVVETNYNKYLKSRGIDQIEPRFQGKVFTDRYNNAVFAHIDREGVCCLEKRNKEYKGMSKGGEKGLWCSHVYKSDNRLVITEAPIDSLSYDKLHGDQNTRYISFGGRMNEKQQELLKSAINRMPDNSKIILATDIGKDGDNFAREIAVMSENKTHNVLRHTPNIGKDWNEELKHVKGIETIKGVEKTIKPKLIDMGWGW